MPTTSRSVLLLLFDAALIAGGLYWHEPWPVAIGVAGLVVDAFFLHAVRKQNRNPF